MHVVAHQAGEGGDEAICTGRVADQGAIARGVDGAGADGLVGIVLAAPIDELELIGGAGNEFHGHLADGHGGAVFIGGAAFQLNGVGIDPGHGSRRGGWGREQFQIGHVGLIGPAHRRGEADTVTAAQVRNDFFPAGGPRVVDFRDAARGQHGRALGDHLAVTQDLDGVEGVQRFAEHIRRDEFSTGEGGQPNRSGRWFNNRLGLEADGLELDESRTDGRRAEGQRCGAGTGGHRF